jgi:hypothetical protein
MVLDSILIIDFQTVVGRLVTDVSGLERLLGQTKIPALSYSIYSIL